MNISTQESVDLSKYEWLEYVDAEDYEEEEERAYDHKNQYEVEYEGWCS